ncbi:MAG: hypothetical protein K6A62_03920 [Bacteroidales bacterium]|nr:hypothetical protein [Bacteroidales bacterium]
MSAKTTLAFLAALLLSLSLLGQNTYRVFRVNGDVTRCIIPSSEWIPVYKKDIVNLSDNIRIPEGGEVRIVASESGIIHACAEPGTFSVQQIIAESEAARKGLLAASTGELASELRDKAGKKGSIKAHGATVRGYEVLDESVEKALAERIRQNKGGLKVRLVRSEDGFRFRIRNNGAPCMACIVCLTPEGASLCLPAEGVAIRRGATTLPTPEIEPAPDAKYVAFRVEEEFDEGLLMLILAD